jgi:hypothetical protein
MIQLKKIMELKQPFISAASGLVELEDKFFVIADDENFLGVYDLETLNGSAFPIFHERLSENKALRKKQKSDFEALVLLPERKKLLIVPSGSTANRERGAVMSASGQFEKEISFHALYTDLRKYFSELNIEGGVVFDEDLWLFQRGNGQLNQNGIFVLNLNDLLLNKKLTPKTIPIQLGALKDVSLSFTDATKADGNILFLAVAENTLSTYLDGAIVGSILGIMNRSGEILHTSPLVTDSKPEGISYNSLTKCFHLVTDDDDRDVPSALYRGNLPKEWENAIT